MASNHHLRNLLFLYHSFLFWMSQFHGSFQTFLKCLPANQPDSCKDDDSMKHRLDVRESSSFQTPEARKMGMINASHPFFTHPNRDRFGKYLQAYKQTCKETLGWQRLKSNYFFEGTMCFYTTSNQHKNIPSGNLT